MNASLLVLAVAALIVPTFAAHLNTPAAAHTGTLSNTCAVVLLVVYAASIPFYFRQAAPAETSPPEAAGGRMAWPLKLSAGVLGVASLAAAAVSDWFVSALQPATHSLGLSQTFTGLVVVALASNAVEHVVGIQFALRAKPEFAMSTTLNSPLQVALLLTPVLVLLSSVVGPHKLTLVFPPLLVAALAVSAVVVVVVIYDGEYTWLEGLALMGLYVMIAASFWWG
jgi:Ca2+:H+ antiporter